MRTYTQTARRRARQRGVLAYALDPEEAERWLGGATPKAIERALRDSLGWCKRHPPLEEAERALQALMSGGSLTDGSAATYRAGVLHLCQFFGRALESDASADLDWDLVGTCDRALLELGAPWTLESMLDGPSIITLPELSPTGTGWFDPDACEEIDGFFEELDREELAGWLEEVGGGEREAEVLEEIERWFALVAERGWALATFWS